MVFKAFKSGIFSLLTAKHSEQSEQSGKSERSSDYHLYITPESINI